MNKNRQLLEEAIFEAESQQSELLETNKKNIFPKQNLDEYDLANKGPHESLFQKTNQIKDQSEVEKLVK